jgi:oligopeptide/dipeptide ABC transporter ATP-binding protein
VSSATLARSTGPEASAPLLSVENLAVSFAAGRGRTRVLHDVSLQVRPGMTLGIVGESGCGKSVTSLAILRLLGRGAAVDDGRVRFDEQDLLTLPEPQMREIRGRDIAMIFQDPMSNLNPVLTIGEQIGEVIRRHAGASRRAARDRSAELLQLVGIPSARAALHRYPHEFSGGMRQRVMIATALAMSPRLLIADEPTTALDVTIQAQVLELMRRLVRDSGAALILITHNLGVVAGMTEQVAVMYAGRIVEEGSTADLFARPAHPYTVGLLHSLAGSQTRGQDLVPIPGNVPAPGQLPAGCAFAPRCRWRLAQCWTDMPGLGPAPTGARAEGGGGHRVACHNPATPDEAAAGLPGRSLAPAPPPGGTAVFDALAPPDGTALIDRPLPPGDLSVANRSAEEAGR